MGDKSLKKKQYILEEAARVFKEKGFKNVTMKDIVEACDISRGGLYLYFDSTESVFKAVLKNEEEKSDPDLEKKSSKPSSLSELLTLFFMEQKKDILNNGDSLLKAIYEYSFFKKESMDLISTKEKPLLLTQKEAGERFLEKLLEEGAKTGEFAKVDSVKMSRHIMYTLEGMKLYSRVSDLKEKDINDEMVILYSEILPNNSHSDGR